MEAGTAEEAKGVDTVDGISPSRVASVVTALKSLDANKYATKKTIAQGMLDIALLTANASQLKYILQVGPKHEFYTILLTLILISIVLQVASGIIYGILGVKLDINKEEQHQKSNLLNNIQLGLSVSIVAFNVVIGVFYNQEPSVNI